MPLCDLVLQNFGYDLMLLHNALVLELIRSYFDLEHGSAATACIPNVQVFDCQCLLQFFLYG